MSVTNGATDTFAAFTETGHRSPDSGAVSGVGGGILTSWADDQAIINNLLTGSFTNASSYDLPPVIYQNTVGWATFNQTDQQPQAVESVLGAGGADLQSWTSTESIIDNLLTGTFTNASSYPTPASVFEGVAWASFNETEHSPKEDGVEVGYNFSGTRASGKVLLWDKETGDRYVIEGASIQTERGGRVFTDTADPETGEYELPVAEGGDYDITASHPLLGSTTRTLTFQTGESRPNEEFLLTVPRGFQGIARRSLGGKG